MGKYMRKCRGAAGEEVAGVEVTQLVGVRTRSRSAAAPAPAGGVAKVVAPKRKKPATPPNVAAAAAGEPAAGADGGDDGSCYIKLRSRTLFMAPPQPQPSAPTMAQVPAEAAGGAAALVAGLSRCSSTASSVDAGCQERSLLAASRSDAAEAGGDHILEISTSNSGNDPAGRERRETTPSSRAQGEVAVSDLESDLAGQQKSSPAATTTSAPQLITPPEDEIREFFAAAEKEQAEHFAAKYNFDIVRGVPLDGGRFEWTPVVSI